LSRKNGVIYLKNSPSPHFLINSMYQVYKINDMEKNPHFIKKKLKIFLKNSMRRNLGVHTG